MRGSIAAKISLGFLLAAASLLIVGWNFYRGAKEFLQSDGGVRHSQLVVEQTNEVFSLLKDAETNQRAFSMTGEETYAEPYNESVRRLPEALNRLLASVNADPARTQQVKELSEAVKAKLLVTDQHVAERRQLGARALDPQRLNHRGKAAMDKVREVAGRILEDERQVLNSRLAVREGHVRSGMIAFCVLAGVFGLLTVAVYAFIMRDLRSRRRIEVELAAARDVALDSARAKR